MSVINKMLRDLDHRANPAATVPSTQSGLRQGTASVTLGTNTSTSPTANSAPRLGLVLGMLVVAAVATGGWFWWSANMNRQNTSTVTSTVAAIPAAVAVTPAANRVAASEPKAVDAPAATETKTPTLDAALEPSVMSLRMESSLSARKALDALLSKPPASVRATAPAAAATSTASAAAPEPAPTPRPPAATMVAAPAPAGNSTPVLQRQQQAGGDALAQVQSLWSSGSHDAAIDLMQQSIAAEERGAKAGAGAGTPGTSGTSSGGNAVLVPLVREMARMQLAEARFGAVWEMLTRLEPLLGNHADLWAIRANAAQRLGRHPDSVRSYMMALQSRPDEQRWLLGTAVSLAALGQTSSAAEMADKARAVGPVSKDILAYLRQTGVPIRE